MYKKHMCIYTYILVRSNSSQFSSIDSSLTQSLPRLPPQSLPSRDTWPQLHLTAMRDSSDRAEAAPRTSLCERLCERLFEEGFAKGFAADTINR